jgi:hypothetical protein
MILMNSKLIKIVELVIFLKIFKNSINYQGHMKSVPFFLDKFIKGQYMRLLKILVFIGILGFIGYINKRLY